MPYLLGAPFIGATQAAALESLGWRLPAYGNDGAGWACQPNVTASAVLVAPAGTYNVTLRFQGVIEVRDYLGGTNDGDFWQIGGQPDGQVTQKFRNIYGVVISSPSFGAYINRANGRNTGACYLVDFKKTLVVDAGATITLWASAVAGDGTNQGALENSHAITYTGITSPSQPYFGQWCNATIAGIKKV